ncbi:glycoside hydrolase family 6 protein [Nonomuraea jabiensis]|uniref:Serine/threonine protein kinase n=1 Tax=Nonomuraea jabiensis TaxID=882448 RepID=A0A7W9LCU9_9ACTN|nr:glycoside hydrolase family 6 protein [Nonomuraea jabiensis]MBB5779141.1 serine/threonine protein kinase [Nonomuraea jabiensis]
MAYGTKHGEAVDGRTGDDPRRIGGHRIVRRLGSGGMGIVYLAKSRSRRLVAIKVIHRHLAGDPEFRRRFRREVATMRRVAPFSTAPVLTADLDGETAYVVTEYVPGPTLFRAVVERGPMSGSELEGLAMSTAVALWAIHAAGVVHRDLKPSNVLLSPVGPKVIDFGLAFVSDSTTLSVTRMGTPAYMSPEQVRGLASPASDVFAWGGVMVFAASGRPPFGSGAGHDVLYRVVHEEPELPELGGVLGQLVARALSKDPAARPTAAELVDALGGGATLRLSPDCVPIGPLPRRRSSGRFPYEPQVPHPAETASGRTHAVPEQGHATPDGAHPATEKGRTTPDQGRTAGDPGRAALDRSRTTPDRSRTAPDRGRAAPAHRGRRRGASRRWAWAGGAVAALAVAAAGVVLVPGLLPGLPAVTQAGSPAVNPSVNPAVHPAVEEAGRLWRELPGENPLRADGVRFYVQPDTDAARQARTWSAQGRTADAALMRSLSQVPQAIWLAGGSPADVSRTVREAAAQAAGGRTVPVFVTNNIPGRDCWNGGAPDTASYRAWIDAVAEGIGNRPAVVALEPSGLARMPGSPECPRGGESAAVQRYADLSYAVETLTGLARTGVYLDGGLAGWPAFTQIADRLVNAGAVRADGFYVNAVGYRQTARSLTYAAKLSRCVYLRAASGTASCADAALAAVPDDAPGLPHFVVDTSRNGTGEWQPPAGRFRVPDEWCNPPGRGAGARPSADTGKPLADAYLWLNSPGFSNGQCTRGTPGPADPVYGIVTPASGQWWPDQALERARNAVPPLTPAP